ncbi:type IV pilin-like G/H family protein [Nostoc sp. UCD120]|uniref:type IV pilin-like G/H family protein n=1 Tax=Nostoc sp. UCD120 TaxID=2681312 RepID=UPI002892F467|nr:type IV pilin-like G/H family protein [Nostoc sp. UCD120]
MHLNFERRLILGLWFLGTIVGSIIILVNGVVVCFTLYEVFFGCNMTCKAHQAVGKIHGSSFNRAQQSYYLNNERFSTSLSDLQAGIEPKTGKYNFLIKTINTPKKHEITYFYAVSSVPGLKSYLSAVTVTALPAIMQYSFSSCPSSTIAFSFKDDVPHSCQKCCMLSPLRDNVF